MSFEIDPAFRKGGAHARQRRQRRLIARLGAVALIVLLGGIGLFLVISGKARDNPQAELDAPQGADSDDLDEFTLVQTDVGQESGVRRDPRASFIHLRRDPMILRLDVGDASAVTRIAGPAGFAPTRAGLDGPERLSVLRDALFVGERQLVTTLPSSRDDFAMFQAQRSQAIAEMQTGRPALPSAPVEAGEVVRIEDDSSWGSFISGDADAAIGAETGTAVYVETRIENTTSIALTLRETQRFALFEDTIVVLQAERGLEDILRSNGLDELQAKAAVQAATRLLSVPDKLPEGGIIALRLRPDVEGSALMQMSIYGPEGYLASLAQVGAGRFEPSADPWLEDNLMGRSDRLRVIEPLPQQDVRLLDAVYSAAIRNGLPTNLVGEMIVILSQRFDLDRFVADGDRLTVLFASDPGPGGQGLGQLLFVGIDGPSGEMHCYVTEADSAAGFACFDFEATETVAAAGQMGGGFLIPVNGVKTSGFGPRHHPILRQVRNHNGVDWAAPTGTPVRAAADGVLNYVGLGGGYGNVIYIDHAGGMQTRYAHLNAFADGMRKGVQVTAGQTIGFVGTTGRSTGPHLHFELYVNGTPVDPLTFGGVSTGGAPGSAAVEALVNQIIRVESAGNARAKNPLSTATGLGQFIESTWLRMMRDYRPDLASTMTRQQLLDLRFDPALSREMVTNLARENESFLRARGHQITAGRLYLAHFLGPAGAHTALSASTEASVLEVMGSAVVNANPFLRGKTIADLRDWADRKMAGAGRGGGAIASAPVVRRVTVPPEVKAYRETVDQVLAAL